MKTKKIVAALDAMTGVDYEKDHGDADDLLLLAVPHEVRVAYKRLRDRAPHWPTA